MSSPVNHTDKKVQSFLRKVMTGLEEDCSSCWGWHHSGSFFFIVDEKPFASVLFRLFRNRRVQAFVQQLLHLGFSKLNTDSVETAHGTQLAVAHVFSHSLFLRGCPELLPQIGKLGAPLVTQTTPQTPIMFANNITSPNGSNNPIINGNNMNKDHTTDPSCNNTNKNYDINTSTTPIIHHPLYPAQPNTTHTTTTTTTTITHSTSMYIESDHFVAHDHFHTNTMSKPSPIEEHPSDDGNTAAETHHTNSHDAYSPCSSPLLLRHHRHLHHHHQDGTDPFVLDPSLISSSICFPSQPAATIADPQANDIIPPHRIMVSTTQSFPDLDLINGEDAVTKYEKKVASFLHLSKMPQMSKKSKIPKIGQEELEIGSLPVHNPYFSSLLPSLFPSSHHDVHVDINDNNENNHHVEQCVAQLEALLSQIDQAASSLASMIDVNSTNLSIWSSQGLLGDQQFKCPLSDQSIGKCPVPNQSITDGLIKCPPNQSGSSVKCPPNKSIGAFVNGTESLPCSIPFSSLPYPTLSLLPLTSLIDNTHNYHHCLPNTDPITPIDPYCSHADPIITPLLSSTPLLMTQLSPQTPCLVHDDLSSTSMTPVPPITRTIPLIPCPSSWTTPQSSVIATPHTPLDFGMINPPHNQRTPSFTSPSSSSLSSALSSPSSSSLSTSPQFPLSPSSNITPTSSKMIPKSSHMTQKASPGVQNNIHQPHPGGKRKCPFPIDPSLPTDYDNDSISTPHSRGYVTPKDNNNNRIQQPSPPMVSFPLDCFGTHQEPSFKHIGTPFDNQKPSFNQIGATQELSFNPALMIVDPVTNTTLGQNLPRSTTMLPTIFLLKESHSTYTPYQQDPYQQHPYQQHPKLQQHLHQQHPYNHSTQSKLAQRVCDVQSGVNELLKKHMDSMSLQIRTYRLLQQGLERLAASGSVDVVGGCSQDHNSDYSTPQDVHIESSQIQSRSQHSSSTPKPSPISQPTLPVAAQRTTKRTKMNLYYDELSSLELHQQQQQRVCIYPQQQQRVLSQYLGSNSTSNHPTTLPISSLVVSLPTRSIFSPSDDQSSIIFSRNENQSSSMNFSPNNDPSSRSIRPTLNPSCHINDNLLSDSTPLSSTGNTTHPIHQDLTEIEGIVQYVLTPSLENNENSEDNNNNGKNTFHSNPNKHFVTHLSTLDHCPTIANISLSPHCSKQLNTIAPCHNNGNNGHTRRISVTHNPCFNNTAISTPCSNLAISTSTTIREVHVATRIPSQSDCTDVINGGSIELVKPGISREPTILV